MGRLSHGKLIGGALLITVGVLIATLVPRILQNFVNAKLQFGGPREAMYEAFRNNTAIGATVLKENYFFTLLNEEGVRRGERPQLREDGPWVYQEIKVHPEADTRWLANGTVQYKPRSSYVFRADLSGGRSEEDAVTVPSMGLLGAMKIIKLKLAAIAADPTLTPAEVRKKQSGLMEGAQFFMGVVGEDYFTTRSVKALLFGYEDPYLSALVAAGQTSSATVAIEPDSPVNLPAGFDEQYSGGPASKEQPNPPKNSLKSMTMWRGYRMMPFWNSTEANTMDGTDGTGFHTDIKEGASLLTFVNSIKRKMVLCYGGRRTYKNVLLYRHQMCASELENQTVNPRNAAYGMEHQGYLGAPLFGPMSALALPYFFTKPHFLDADTSPVHVDFIGARTNSQQRDLFDTFLDIEPHTGATFSVRKRMQVNVRIGPFVTADPHEMNTTMVWPISRGINETIYPVYWVAECSDLPNSLVNTFKSLVYLPLHLSLGLGVALAVIGGLLMIHALYKAVCADDADDNDGLLGGDPAAASGAVDGSAYYSCSPAAAGDVEDEPYRRLAPPGPSVQ